MEAKRYFGAARRHPRPELVPAPDADRIALRGGPSNGVGNDELLYCWSLA